MKKLVEIPFNHELIGKEGIEVKYRSGRKVLEAHYFKKTSDKDCIISTCEEKHLWGHKITGRYTDRDSPLDLIMYQEVEVKEPRVIWTVESLNGIIISKSDTLQAANNVIDYFGTARKNDYKITKFIEVIEEGE